MSRSQTNFYLQSLNSVHQELNELFIRHQAQLMHQDIAGALTILNELHKKYKSHIHDEESLLLPLYLQKVNPLPPGGAAEFYIREHRKIEQYLKRFIAVVSDWQENSSFTPLRLVDLFDQHYAFNDLLNHHHAREDTFLYRLLDRVVKQEEKKTVFQRLSILPKAKTS